MFSADFCSKFIFLSLVCTAYVIYNDVCAIKNNFLLSYPVIFYGCRWGWRFCTYIHWSYWWAYSHFSGLFVLMYELFYFISSSRYLLIPIGVQYKDALGDEKSWSLCLIGEYYFGGKLHFPFDLLWFSTIFCWLAPHLFFLCDNVFCLMVENQNRIPVLTCLTRHIIKKIKKDQKCTVKWVKISCLWAHYLCSIICISGLGPPIC